MHPPPISPYTYGIGPDYRTPPIGMSQLDVKSEDSDKASLSKFPRVKSISSFPRVGSASISSEVPQAEYDKLVEVARGYRNVATTLAFISSALLTHMEDLKIGQQLGKRTLTILGRVVTEHNEVAERYDVIEDNLRPRLSQLLLQSSDADE